MPLLVLPDYDVQQGCVWLHSATKADKLEKRQQTGVMMLVALVPERETVNS